MGTVTKRKPSFWESLPVYTSIIVLLISSATVLITLTIVESGIVKQYSSGTELSEPAAGSDKAENYAPTEAERLGMPVPDEIRCSISKITMPDENIPGYLVSLTWLPVEGAEIYEVHIIQNESGIILPRTFQTTDCFYETGTGNQAEFTFRVRAVSAGEVYSTWSEPVKAKTF